MRREILPSGISLIDILQLYHTKGVSGTLIVIDRERDENGWVTLENGEVINCGIGARESQAALVELCGRSSLAFDYLNEMVFPEQIIRKTFAHLLLEITVQIDEEVFV